MPNTREKLIELLVRTACNGSEEPGCCPSRKYGFCGEVNKLSYCTIQHIADHLIANGVTFATDNNVGSKWIPVTERLPENDSDVLAYLRIGEKGRIYPANYASGMWFDCIFNTPATDTTTHWMSLPQPPKENDYEK